jgi:hypothetical protein
MTAEDHQDRRACRRQRSKAIIGAVNELCGALRPHARTLVDAFGGPDEALSAPIAWPDDEL